MKKKARFFIFFFLLMLPCITYSQRAVVGLSKMNILYIGVDNPVDIAISGLPDDKIVVAIDNGTIIGERGKYFVRPIDSKNIRETKIYVSYKKSKKVIPLDTFIFRIKAVPAPISFFGSKSGAVGISKAELLFQSVLSAQLENFIFEGLRHKIISYNFNIIKENSFISFSDTGSMISRNIRKKISSVETGDKIVIDKIIAQDWNGKILNLPRIELFINYPPGDYPSDYSIFQSDSDKYYYTKYIYYQVTDSFSKNKNELRKYYYRHTDTSKHLLKEEVFKHNKLVKSTEFFRNGKIFFVTVYPHPDSLIGYYKKYFPNGRAESDGYVKRDLLGVYVVYLEESKVIYPMGFLRLTQPIEYRRIYDSIFGDLDFSFVRTGTWKFYHKNGKIKSIGDYTNEVEEGGNEVDVFYYNNIVSRHGKWLFYKENGKLEKEVIYDKGEIISEIKY